MLLYFPARYILVGLLFIPYTLAYFVVTTMMKLTNFMDHWYVWAYNKDLDIRNSNREYKEKFGRKTGS